MRYQCPEGFLKEEIREDYLVTEERKKVWVISIGILEAIKRICDKHSLTYYAIGGTAIGAVRHKGFIPWDDDIDVALKREDYDKFIKYASEELDYPFFLQTSLTDRYFYGKNFARVRNSLTTGIALNDGYLKCNNGIFVDVMPLDGYEDSFKCNMFCCLEKIRTTLAWNEYHYKSMKEHGTLSRHNAVLRSIGKLAAPLLLRDGVINCYSKHEEACREFSKQNYEKIGWQYSHLQFGRDYKKWTFPKEIFDGIVELPFEYTSVPLPAGYKMMLHHQFGDYMKLPPIEERGKWHEFEQNPDVDYKTYCSLKYGVDYNS